MSDFELGKQLGRYRLSDVLGRGAFGTVYLGFNDELHRKVAIKVPHPECVRHERDIEEYIAEARTVAQLQHDGITSVFDVGRTDDGLCYVVSQFIDGESLAARLRTRPPTVHRAVEIAAAIAETLEYVHQQMVVHRDIKPGNILLSVEDKVFVTDFGLALRDHQLRHHSDISGTPRYMSPEQARGESHLVDGRSDIFSLGILLYKLITGVHPFTGSDTESILRNIARAEPQPPRELNPLIPPALQRVCLKAMAKSIGQRYSRASLLAEDLRRVEFDEVSARSIPSISASEPTQLMKSGDLLVGVTPRGLRSFDDSDARFFMKLLPGPFDAEGLPESLRFWKTKIECRKAADTFRVGVIYGPSGCGKSSLVKAGLLPVLDSDIDTIFVEATPDQTQRRLQTRLGQLGIPFANADLRDCLQTLRNDRDSERKIVIVIDQFEQWLHAVADPGQSDLAAALRQCDGERLQCVLLVRDDFWLAVSRFMGCLDIDLAQNQNMRMVDLFDPIHARRVLAEFGAGYGRLPGSMGELDDEQNLFLDHAIEGLSHDDKIIPVRLALFAEMVKGRPWTVAAFNELGGIEGVGGRFLEECFENSTAPAEQRVHRNAVQNTLVALLPDHGTDIKGGMKSYSELLNASGYANQPDQFRALLRILDTNLRLITPTDPMGLAPEEASEQSGMRFYQLTHDFLVPAIRERLTASQRSSRRGRAQLLLSDLSGSWSRKRDRRSLPSWFEWLQIQLLTDRKRWTTSQREVIGAATKRTMIAAGLIAAVISAVAVGLYEYRGVTQADALVNQLSTAKVQDVPAILDQLKGYQRWSLPRLKSIRKSSEPDSQAGLFAALALLPSDVRQSDFLRERLLSCRLEEQALVVDALQSNRNEIVPVIWSTLQDDTAEPTARFRAALALARMDPPTEGTSDQWLEVEPVITSQLVESATYDRQAYASVMASVVPLTSVVAAPLSNTIRRDSVDPVQKIMARQLLIDLLQDQPQELTSLILSAEIEDVARTLPTLDKHRNEVLAVLREAVLEGYEDTLSTEEWQDRARRQSMAAALLLRDRQPRDAWDVLRKSVQPDARTYLIHLARPLAVDPALLIARLLKEKDVGIRSGLLLILGEYDLDQIPQLDSVVDFVSSTYINDGDSSVHSAAQWLLVKWKGHEYVEQIALPQREPAGSISGGPQWRADAAGFTMVSIRPNQSDVLPFEISATEIQPKHIRPHIQGYSYEREYAESAESAAFALSWFDAIEYCQKQTLASDMTVDDQCYIEVDEEDRFRLKSNYQSLRGYRLPTQQEWETALMGGAESVFAFGNDVQMLSHYEWVDQEEGAVSRIPGQKKPNSFGLFDMNGNLTEWCSDLSYKTSQRPARGGTRNVELSYFQSTPRMPGVIVPNIRWRSYGFRVARSIVEAAGNE